jgi:protein-tyrosine phosphatase
MQQYLMQPSLCVSETLLQSRCAETALIGILVCPMRKRKSNSGTFNVLHAHQQMSKRPSQVLPFLYIGDKKHAKNRAVMQELNIKRIVNVTPTRAVDPIAGCMNFFEKEGADKFLYRRIPINDNRGEDLLSHLDSVVAFIEAGRFHGSVLVHCAKGVSRSASVVVAYLMKHRGLTLNDALTYLRLRRPEVKPHEAFMHQLGQFEQRLQVCSTAYVAHRHTRLTSCT